MITPKTRLSLTSLGGLSAVFQEGGRLLRQMVLVLTRTPVVDIGTLLIMD